MGKLTLREAWRRAVRQHRLLQAQKAIGRAAEKLHASGESGLALEAYELAVRIGSKP